MNTERYDYIIVGAGSAGCILANRLSADSANTVLLLEAGGSDKSIFIKMPTALSYPMNTKRYNWDFYSEPEKYLGDRRLHCPRGKVLGGSSSINGMVFVRGNPFDFEEWEQLGAKGWGYKDCLPYFKKMETWHGQEDQYRGGSGPVGVCNGNNMVNPLYTAFIDAGQEAGYLKTDDYNGEQQEGFGAMHMNVQNGVRESTARAYLDPIKKRKNLTIVTKAQVQRIVLDGKQAVGIEYKRAGRSYSCGANAEVILCAGSIGSPMILQHSGIGPKAVLEEAGVDLVHDLPGVGANLQDHLEVYFQYHCKQPVSLNSKLDLFNMGLIGARWFFFRSGLGSTNHFESCAFIRSSEKKKWPDIQYHFLPAAMRYDGGAAIDGHGFQVHVGPNKPKSRGSVKIVSSNPQAAPKITFNYLQDASDVEDWRQCIRLTREILGQPGLDEFRGEEIQPGINVQSDEDIDAWVRDNVESAYHPSCTCKMGAEDDAMAVVDAQCRVQGINNLRVVDSSIFPSITNGNLNAPTMMVAEKAADIILAKSPLAAPQIEPWVDEQWQTRQRQWAPQRTLAEVEARAVSKTA